MNKKVIYKDKEMNYYKDIDNDSGILAYEIREDAIEVRFKNGRNNSYIYLKSDLDSKNINFFKNMCKYAKSGENLNKYINETEIKTLYKQPPTYNELIKIV